MAESAESFFKCLRSCKNHLYQKRSNSNFWTFPVCVPNRPTGDNDVMQAYLTQGIKLVNRCKIYILYYILYILYIYINNQAVILLLMAIYNKNQATFSQNHRQRFQPVVKRRRQRAFTGTYNL